MLAQQEGRIVVFRKIPVIDVGSPRQLAEKQHGANRGHQPEKDSHVKCPARSSTCAHLGCDRIFDEVPANSIASDASCRIVNSSGLPILTGPVKSSALFIMRTRASMMSSTYANDRVCLPSPKIGRSW